MNFLTDILKSFYNSKDGASARKLTAFALMLCVAYIHVNYIDKENAIEALIIDLLFAFLSLSIITAQNLIEIRNGKNENGQGTN